MFPELFYQSFIPDLLMSGMLIDNIKLIARMSGHVTATTDIHAHAGSSIATPNNGHSVRSR